MMYKVALFLSAMISAYPGFAQTPEVQKPATEKKICKEDPGTGSILPKRICRTKAEWQAITRAGREDIVRMRDQRPSTNTQKF